MQQNRKMSILILYVLKKGFKFNFVGVVWRNGESLYIKLIRYGFPGSVVRIR